MAKRGMMSDKGIDDTTRNRISDTDRKIRDACRNGWWMSGRYCVKFDEHERVFVADSEQSLIRHVSKWYATHEHNHENAHVLVKCI